MPSHPHFCNFTRIENSHPLSPAFCLNHPHHLHYTWCKQLCPDESFPNKKIFRHVASDIPFIWYNSRWTNVKKLLVDIIWNLFCEMQLAQFKRTFIFKFNKMLRPEVTKIRSGAIKPFMYHPVNWSNWLKLIWHVPIWWGRKELRSEKIKSCKNEMWKPYKVDKVWVRICLMDGWN